MKKRFTKIMAAIALLVFMVPSMVAWGQTMTTENVTLSNGTFSTDHITWMCANNGITIQQLKGTSGTAVNSSYISAPRVYKGHVLSFVGSETCKIKELQITVSGTYYGNSMTAGTVYSNNTVTDNTTDVARTWTSTSGGTHIVSSVSEEGLPAIYIQNVASATNTQLRFTALSITYIVSGTQPTTYTVTFDAGDGTFVGSSDFPNTSNTVTAGTYTLPSATAPTGFSFNKWNIGQDTYDAGASYTVSGNADFVASYTQNSGDGTVTATLTQSNLELTGSYTTNTEKTIDDITYVFTDLMKSNSNIQARASTGTIKNTTAYPGDITSVVITHYGTARATTINGSADGTNWTQVATGSGSITADFSGKGYKYFQITRGSNAAYWEKIDITYSTSASSQSQSDLAITNASTDLTFDLYNNSTAQIINYTTSSTGAITITPASPTTYFSYVHNATAKTITVTPLAVTPSAQTVTISQEADNDYYAGTATFTVSVANSTPLANIAALTAQTAGTYTVALTNALVTYVNGTNAYIEDASGAVMLYHCAGTLAAGDKITGTANVTYTVYNNLPEVTAIELATGYTLTSGNTVTPETITIADLIANYTNYISRYVKIENATVTSAFSNKNCTIEQNGSSIVLRDQNSSATLTSTLNSIVTVTAHPSIYGSTKQIAVYEQSQIVESQTVYISSDDVNIASSATSGSITYTIEHEPNPAGTLTATVVAGYTISNLSLGTPSNGAIAFTCDANTTSTARTAEITLAYTYGSKAQVTTTITITQAAYVPAPTGDPYVRISNLNQLTDGSIVVIASRYNATATNYYAMNSTIGHKMDVTEFVSQTSGSSEILPSTIVNSINSYYWVVSVNNGTYTFTNASGDMIGYGSSTNFTANNNTAWSIARATSGAALVPSYEGFTITNVNTDTRGIALKNDATPVVFGAYATSNANGDAYNFFLDFFIQTPGIDLFVSGYGDNNEFGGYHLIASPIVESVSPTAVENMIDATEGNYDLYRFNQDNTVEWQNYKGHTEGFVIESGKGYLYAHNTDVTLTFNGTAYSGNGTFALTQSASNTSNGGKMNVLGNPFNTETTIGNRSFYKMNALGTELEAVVGETIGALEGIMVEYDENNPSVTFTTSKSRDVIELLALNLKEQDNNIDRVLVRFDGGNQLHKYQIFGSSNVYVPMDGQNYAVIRGENQGTLPINFKASADGNYTISVNTENIELPYLRLIDNLTGDRINLLNTSSYSFDATTTDDENRFTLVYSKDEVEIKTYKLTITSADFNTTSYAANNNEKTSYAVNVDDEEDTYEVAWTSNQVMKISDDMMQWQKNNGYIYNSTDLGTITDVTVTSTAGTFTTYYGTTAQPSSNTTVGGGYFKTVVGNATGHTSELEVTFEIEVGGATLEPNDLELSTSALTFDLYDDADPQAINFTTSSTGAITVSESDYVTTEVYDTNNTIMVTPVAVTNGVKTITVNQAADDTYAAGSVTFTVEITDSTPFTGGDVTFVAGTDTGSSTTSTDGDEITKKVITISSTKAAFAYNDSYRFYGGSTTTISTSYGVISSIVFTQSGSNNPISNLSTTTGVWSEGTWTGAATSVEFTASAQARASQIVVTVTPPANVATPTFSPEGGTFTEAQIVTISCSTDNAVIYYTIDGSEPDDSSIEYDGPITVSESTTIQAIAYVGSESSLVASETYTILNESYTTIPEIFAAANSTETEILVTFNNWVVSGVSTNGKNVFVTDNNGNGLILYFTSNMSNTFVAGNILSGTAVSCSLKKYNGSAELLNVDAADLTITAGGTVTVAEVAMANLSGINTGALVSYENLTCSVNNNKYYLTDGTTSLQVYNSLYAFGTLKDGKTYNITGVYQQFNNTKEVLPRSAEDIAEVFTVVINGYGNSAGGYHLIASPFTVFPENIEGMTDGEFDLFSFDQNYNGEEWRNYKVNEFELEPGKGYLYAHKTDVTLRISGTPSTDGTVTLHNTGNGDFAGWNLVGNPFGEIAYIAENNDAFYTMDANGEKLMATTSSSIEVMEGIFVYTEEDEEVLTFSTTAPAKNSQITLNLSNDSNVIDRAIIRFDKGRQLPKFQLNSNSTKMYIPKDDNKYAVVSSNKSGRLPVNFEPAEDGFYEISVNTKNVVVRSLRLIDYKEGVTIDLLNNPYRFKAEVDEKPGRFELVYTTGINLFQDMYSKITGGEDFAFISNGTIIVNGEGTLQVFDITGRIVSTEEINGVSNINVNAAAGVYVLQLTNDNEVKTQKIVVK